MKLIEKDVMILTETQSGQTVKIVGFEGGRVLEHKLRQLGLLPGELVRVLRLAPLGGPVLIEVCGREIALGRGVASKITVEEPSCDLP